MIKKDDGGMRYRTVNIAKLNTGKLAGNKTTKLHGPDLSVRDGIELLLKADASNARDILIGNSATSFPTSGFPLSPGENLVLGIKNLKELYYYILEDGDCLCYLLEVE